MAKFEASSYSRFRVSYPEKLFNELRSYCGEYIGTKGMRVLDLGSGTGFSAESFRAFFPNIDLTLVEPDAAMLAFAESHFLSRVKPSEPQAPVHAVNCTAEAFDIRKPYDLILVGSAWHWMDRDLLLRKFERADISGVFIFEYQFPKSKFNSELNEWVRRAFNLKWRTLTQVPRGNLIELTQGLRDSFFFSEQSRVSFLQEEKFDLENFWGMIISQSRFLAFEQTLPEFDRAAQRKILWDELSEIWGSESTQMFILPYEGIFWRRRKL